MFSESRIEALRERLSVTTVFKIFLNLIEMYTFKGLLQILKSVLKQIPFVENKYLILKDFSIKIANSQ